MSSLTSSYTLPRAWRWTGSTSTSTGLTPATRPSPWPQSTANADVLSSAATSANPGPLLLTPCEGECSHPQTVLGAQSARMCHQNYLEGFGRPWATQTQAMGEKVPAGPSAYGCLTRGPCALAARALQDWDTHSSYHRTEHLRALETVDIPGAGCLPLAAMRCRWTPGRCSHSRDRAHYISHGLFQLGAALPVGKCSLFLMFPNLSDWPLELPLACLLPALPDSQRDLRNKITGSTLLQAAHLHPHPCCPQSPLSPRLTCSGHAFVGSRASEQSRIPSLPQW